MKLINFTILSLICCTSCATLIKDEPEVEKVLEDATVEIIEDLEHA